MNEEVTDHADTQDLIFEVSDEALEAAAENVATLAWTFTAPDAAACCSKLPVGDG